MTEWHTYWDDDIVRVRLEFFKRQAHLHVDLRKPIAGMKLLREKFPELKAMLRNIGHRFVYVLIPEGDEKLYKFEKLFGFEERRRGQGHILMRQETSWAA